MWRTGLAAVEFVVIIMKMEPIGQVFHLWVGVKGLGSDGGYRGRDAEG